jgi:hypothetical protein
MVVEITCTPEEPRATVDACRIDVTGADQNAGASDPETYPVQAEQRYYLAFRDDAGDELGRSYVFGVGADGEHQFNSYVWPGEGSASAEIALVDASDDSDVETLAVNVLAPDGTDLT